VSPPLYLVGAGSPAAGCGVGAAAPGRAWLRLHCALPAAAWLPVLDPLLPARTTMDHPPRTDRCGAYEYSVLAYSCRPMRRVRLAVQSYSIRL
jgi:hypothetical protein